MTRSRLLATLTILGLTLVVWFAWPRPEPQFQGMPASDYARSILSNNFFNLTLVTNRLTPMGREVAVSALTKVLAHEDSPWKHRYQKLLPRAPMWLRKWLGPPQIDQNMVIHCARALGSFGPEAKPAVRTLTTSLDQGSDFVKRHVAEALSRIGPEARAAIPSLLATAVRSESVNSKGAATNSGMRALTNAGFTDEDSTFFRVRLAEALSSIGPDSRAVDYSLLSSARWPMPGRLPSQARVAAIFALADIDPRGERSAHKLATLIDDPDASVVAAVTDTLGSMAKHSPSLVPRLPAALEHSQLQVCLIAALHLKKLRALTRADLEPFIKRLQSSDATSRAFGATVLMYAQSFESDVMPALLQAASDTNAVVREAAVTSLTLFAYDSMVPHPHRVVAAKAILQNGSAEQTWKMLNWLPQLLPEAGGRVPLLIAALSNPSERTRGKAAQTLGQIGVLARDAVPTLLQLRTDEWRNVREAATNALKAIDTSAQQGTLRSVE